MDSFKDKVAIVTGGASGLGRTICRQLGTAGAIVVIADIDDKGAESVAAGIQTEGGRASVVPLDVTKAGAVRCVVEETVSQNDRLDYIFNNAAVNVLGEARDLELQHWKKVLDVNLMGVLHGTLAAYQVMIHQGSGHIVNIASLAGLTGLPASIPYTTSKYAIVGLSTTLRAEAAELGVKVSVVCPGFLDTELVNTSAVKLDKEKLRSRSRRLMSPDRAATIILQQVERNTAIIVFPSSARTLWRMHRLFPRLTERVHRTIIQHIRLARMIT